MIELRSYNGLVISRAKAGRDHHGLVRGLRELGRVVGQRLGAATFWVAGLCPLYVFHKAVLQNTYRPLGPLSCLALIGIGLSFIYISSYLVRASNRPFPMTTALLISFGLAVGLAGLWTSI